MISSEATGLIHSYFSTPDQINPSPFPSTTFNLMNSSFPAPFHFNKHLTNTNYHQISPPYYSHDHPLAPQSSCLSNNSSTSDEAEDQQLINIIDERKQRRMISNRESARRSRMRKQRHLDELRSQVFRMMTENHNLVDKYNYVAESLERVVQENVRLKEEALDLRQMLSDLRLGSPFSNDDAFLSRDHLEEVSCNTAHLRVEASNQSINTSSTNLLH
ncbi:hypothetical protein ACH5RR_036018 [Cinchona calisaya]|uniref:BZIP domain-containing protein n=1 Tax=Cinchona calisaya TaxID=153742 RepID=A0ABD2Y1Z7_9GENT